jgi:DNA-binding NarL/FixJ family response regulator
MGLAQCQGSSCGVGLGPPWKGYLRLSTAGTRLGTVPPMDRFRIVLAEDNLLVREGLVSLLGATPEIELLAACSSLDDLLDAVAAHGPDVVLTDIRMPPDHADEGIQAARLLRQRHPDVGVVVISQFADPAYALAVFETGTRGRGYLLKDRVDDLSRLLAAIRAVAGGGSFIDEEIVEALIRSRSRLVDSPMLTLTPREREVLAEIATGRSNTAVAAHLGVSENAVGKHISSIFAKLGLTEDDEVNRRVKAVLVYLAGRPA